MGNNDWIEIGWAGQRFYLPEYTKIYREVENKLSTFLEAEDFLECLFPKHITKIQREELMSSLPRLSVEWSNELINLEDNLKSEKRNLSLTHWQCEPFYYFIKQLKPKESLLLFDKSGWSYRDEKEINDFRLFEFQRIECVFYSKEDKTEKIQKRLVEGLDKILKEYGLNTVIIRKNEEEIQTKEKFVYDIICEHPKYGEIELVGSHLHGELFIKKLNINLPEKYYTGCCGIGISRIVNILIGK